MGEVGDSGRGRDDGDVVGVRGEVDMGRRCRDIVEVVVEENGGDDRTLRDAG